MTIDLFKPMYFGSHGNRQIGIADYRVNQEGDIVQISIKDTYKGGKLEGKLIYPTLLCMPKSQVIKYPLEPFVSKRTGHKVMLYKIPIADFQHQKFDLKEAQYYEAIKESEKPKKVETKSEIEQGILL
jgi:hypothetical protein